MIYLEEVNETNWRLDLKVTDDQRRYVSDSNRILARAFAYRNSRSRAYVIYDDKTAVGMVMYYDCESLGAYDFSQLFIDKRHQGKGYGKEAVRLVLEMMKQDGRFRKVALCYIEGNTAARNLYEGFGFQVTDRDEDEIIMELSL